jgi:DNA-binding NarL/FixJ family response regulator
MTLADRNSRKNTTAEGQVDQSAAVALLCQESSTRDRLATVLADEIINVAAQIRSMDDIADQASERLSAVVLVSETLADDSIQDIVSLRANDPDLAIVVVADSSSPRALRAALAAGADGVIAAENVSQALPLALRSVWTGQITLPREWNERTSRPPLSAREKQILGMVVLGFSNADIASQLFLAESTVKSHLSSAFSRLGVRSRAEAAALILDEERGLGAGILTISG